MKRTQCPVLTLTTSFPSFVSIVHACHFFQPFTPTASLQMPQLLSVFASCSLRCLPSLLFIQARISVMEDREGDLKEI